MYRTARKNGRAFPQQIRTRGDRMMSESTFDQALGTSTEWTSDLGHYRCRSLIPDVNDLDSPNAPDEQ